MLCTNCNKNEAVMHMVTVVNGVKNEQHLCAECANQQQNKFTVMPFSMGDMFTPTAHKRSCSVCGMTSAHLKKTGKVGCGNCYKDLVMRYRF